MLNPTVMSIAMRDMGDLIKLANLNLVKIDSISYEMFGAQLDGEHDDTRAIKACHDFANAYNLKVVQTRGTIYITDTITVQTPTDLSGCTLLIKPGCENKTLYKITSKYSPVPVTSYTQSQFVKKSRLFSSLSAYKHQLVTISSNELLCVRINGSSTVNVFKKESMILGRDGLSTTELINDYTTGTLTITAQQIESDILEFGGFNLVWNFQNFDSQCCAVWVERSNTKVRDIKMNVPNTIDYNDTGKTGHKNYLMRVQNCCNFYMENVVGENITEGVSVSGYFTEFSNVVGIYAHNLNITNGWGVFSSEMTKEWVVRDSVLNRIDVHHTGGNMHLDNVKLLGGWGIALGYGIGRTIIENCSSDFVNSDGQNLNSVVLCGTTYGLVYEGEIIIRNHKIKYNNADNKLVNIGFTVGNGNHQIAYDVQLPSLIARDITIENPATSSVIGYYIFALSGLYNSMNGTGKKIYFPKMVDIDGVNLSNRGDTARFLAFSVNEVVTNIGSYMYGNPVIKLKNIRQGVYSKFITGFTLAEIQADLYPKNLISVIDYSSNPANLIYAFDIENCDGGVRTECDSEYFKARNSDLSALKVEGSGGSKSTMQCRRFEVQNCRIYFTTGSGYDRSFIWQCNAEWKNNLMYLIKIDGANKYAYPFSFSGTTQKVLLGNVFVQTDADTTIANKYWKFVDASLKVPTSL